MRYSMSTLIKLLSLIFIITSLVEARNQREFISPNKMTRAIVYSFADRGIILESRIRVLSRKGIVLFDTSFSSKDHEHGFCVVQAAWTANSKYFVFGMVSSGGHMPWQVFTFVFSIATKEFIEINKVVSPVTSSFKLIPPDSLEATTFTGNINNPKLLKVRLSDLVH